jgi:DUF1016 N-terminal domain
MPGAPPARPGDALPVGYPEFLAEVKTRIAAARTRAALAVNSELIRLYREIGRDTLDREQREGWGRPHRSGNRSLQLIAQTKGHADRFRVALSRYAQR